MLRCWIRYLFTTIARRDKMKATLLRLLLSAVVMTSSAYAQVATSSSLTADSYCGSVGAIALLSIR